MVNVTMVVLYCTETRININPSHLAGSISKSLRLEVPIFLIHNIYGESIE